MSCPSACMEPPTPGRFGRCRCTSIIFARTTRLEAVRCPSYAASASICVAVTPWPSWDRRGPVRAPSCTFSAHSTHRRAAGRSSTESTRSRFPSRVWPIFGTRTSVSYFRIITSCRNVRSWRMCSSRHLSAPTNTPPLPNVPASSLSAWAYPAASNIDRPSCRAASVNAWPWPGR